MTPRNSILHLPGRMTRIELRLSVVRQVVRFLWYVNCPVMAVDEGRVPR